MSNCKNCGYPLDWGFDPDTGRWIPLEPIDTHDDLPRRFQDENGVLRADHRARHNSGATVNVTRLAREVPAEDANARNAELRRAEIKQRRREQRDGERTLADQKRVARNAAARERRRRAREEAAG
jgi:hypothetical protein